MRSEIGLIETVRAGNVERVKYLIGNGVNLDKKDGCHWTALHWVALLDRAEIASLLIEAGCGLNLQDGDGNTTLICIYKIKGKKRLWTSQKSRKYANFSSQNSRSSSKSPCQNPGNFKQKPSQTSSPHSFADKNLKFHNKKSDTFFPANQLT